MHDELRQRLAKEYRYAATVMKESPEPPKKLFYFSVFFAEAQRVLNLEWNRDIALIHFVTEQAHARLDAATRNPSLPIKWPIVYEQLTLVASDLAAYVENLGNRKDSKEELCQILGRLAEILFTTTGNGFYLYEKGLIKF